MGERENSRRPRAQAKRRLRKKKVRVKLKPRVVNLHGVLIMMGPPGYGCGIEIVDGGPHG